MRGVDGVKIDGGSGEGVNKKVWEVVDKRTQGGWGIVYWRESGWMMGVEGEWQCIGGNVRASLGEGLGAVG